METFSDFSFYQEEFGGTLSPKNYQTAAKKAYDEILSVTNQKALKAPTIMENALKMCECALADLLYQFSFIPAGVASANNDGYSISFTGKNTEASASSESEMKSQLFSKYLESPVNLLGRWL